MAPDGSKPAEVAYFSRSATDIGVDTRFVEKLQVSPFSAPLDVGSDPSAARSHSRALQK